jgi:acyl-CoA thioesterase
VTAFQRQLAVHADGDVPGRYGAVIGAEWNCPLVPHGGLVTAVAASAMRTELDAAAQRLRSITVVFAGQVEPGSVEIDVTVLRRGRTMSQVAATLRSVGAPAGHTSVAVFGAARDGFEFTDLVPPTPPEPASCPSFRDRPPGVEDELHFNFWDVVEGRGVDGHAWWEEFAPKTSEHSAWHRFNEAPYTPEGILDPLALVTLCDTMPGGVGERMGSGLPRWLPPSADLTVHLLGDARSEWVLGRKRARHAGDGYASVEIELWDPPTLVAYGTQTMFFTFPDGPPPPDRRRAPLLPPADRP